MISLPTPWTKSSMGPKLALAVPGVYIWFEDFFWQSPSQNQQVQNQWGHSVSSTCHFKSGNQGTETCRVLLDHRDPLWPWDLDPGLFDFSNLIFSVIYIQTTSIKMKGNSSCFRERSKERMEKRGKFNCNSNTREVSCCLSLPHLPRLSITVPRRHENMLLE